MESCAVVKLRFTTDFLAAVVREGADELTLRERRRRRSCCAPSPTPTNVGDNRWEPPLVDEDWHVNCYAIFKGDEGAEWETMCCKYNDLHKAVNLKESVGEQSRPRPCGPCKRPRTKGTGYYYLGSVQQIENRAEVRLAQREKHMKKSNDCFGSSTETYGRKSGTSSIVCCKRNVRNAVLLSFRAESPELRMLGFFFVSQCEGPRFCCFNLFLSVELPTVASVFFDSSKDGLQQ